MRSARANPSFSLYALLVANAVSWHGSAISQLAIPWFVLFSTGSAAQTGLVALGAQAGSLLALLFAARWVDALGYKPSSVLADCCCALAVGALPVLAALERLPLWVIVMVAAARAFCDAPGQIARASLLPELANAAGARLERVNSLSEVFESGSQWSGPLLAGALIAWIGPLEVQWLDAASFLASAALIGGGVPTRARASVALPTQRFEFWAGWRFLLNDAPLRAIFVSSLVFSSGMAALFTVLLPVLAQRDAAGAFGLGLLVAAFGGGAVLGAIVYGRYGSAWSQRRCFLIGVSALGAIFGVMALGAPWYMVCLACALGGLVAGPNGPLIQTMLQRRTPEPLRARVFAASSLLSLAASPLGVLLAGLGIERLGLAAVAAVVALSFALAMMAVAFDRGWRAAEAVRASSADYN